MAKHTNRVVDRTGSYLLVEDNQGRTFKISPEDEERVFDNNTYWSVQTSPVDYVCTQQWSGSEGRSTTILLHRFLKDPRDGMIVDHINHNPTDNTRENLRVCTRQENQRNQQHQHGCSSKYKGVCWDKHRKNWHAYIKYNGKKKNLGRFTIEEDAARAYNEAATDLFGDFKLLNVITKN